MQYVMLLLIFAPWKIPVAFSPARLSYLFICLFVWYLIFFLVTPPAPLLKSCQRKEEEDENEEMKTFEVSPSLGSAVTSDSGVSVHFYTVNTNKTAPAKAFSLFIQTCMWHYGDGIVMNSVRMTGCDVCVRACVYLCVCYTGEGDGEAEATVSTGPAPRPRRCGDGAADH